MTKFEALLSEARTLSPAEIAQLIAELRLESVGTSSTEELEAGLRGLAAWTESSRSDSWEEFYPASLRNGRGESH